MRLVAPFAFFGLLGACAADPTLHTDIGLNRDGVHVTPAATARVGIMTLSVTP
ncbi:MAG: hypothetical protein H5U24_12825 [Thioclava marina]|jgi:hypothetical protein|uniref:hypothetical protein n=1 Tax=Thioclava TaxID=285107 RepID=UPI001314ADE0|nr:MULTISPECIES: hypothetical protein [Thioclava]MBC7146273.1 hypothetical protein [Thioclava marina]MBD3803909.1 hypothetical protein [Thioclava sp.]